MPKKYNKPLRHNKDKHHSKSKASRRPKGDSESRYSNDATGEKLKVDKNACGDYFQQSTVPKAEEPKRKYSKDKERSSKKDKEKGRRHQKPEPKQLVKSVRHQSLEKNNSSFITKTKLLFRKEKSFDDAVKNSDEIKKEDGEGNKEKKHKHHSRRSHKDGKLDTKPTNLTKENLPEIKEKREESHHKRSHKSADASPHPPVQNFNRVQEVVFCQMTNNPCSTKNDKNASEVKDLYRRLKGGHKHDEQQENSSKHKSSTRPKPITETYVKDSKKKANEAFVVESNNPSKNRKRDTSGISLGLYERYFSSQSPRHEESSQQKAELGAAKEERHAKKRSEELYERYFSSQNPRREVGSQQNAELGAGKEERHSKKRSEEPYERYISSQNPRHEEGSQQKTELRKAAKEDRHLRKSSEEARKETCQVEEQKIHQIVEGDLKNYLGRIQSLIDRKLDAILQLSKSKERKKKKEKADDDADKKRKRSKSKGKKGPEENDNQIKEEIVNEVLKRLKAEENKEEQKKKKKFSSDIVTKTNTSKETYESGSQMVRELAKRHHRHRSRRCNVSVEESAAVTKKPENSGPTEQKTPDLGVPKHGTRHHHHEKHRPSEDAAVQEQIRHKSHSPHCNEPHLIKLAPYTSASSCKSFSEQQIFFSKNVTRNKHLKSASEETVQRHHHQAKPRSSPARVSHIDPYKNFLRQSPPRGPPVQESPYLRQIFLPPDSFRGSPTQGKRQEFIVQGIEPPIRESRPARRVQNPKRLECKTVSIIAIQPQIDLRDPHRDVEKGNETQTKSQRSSGERDLVERRKMSKRFKLYYKYSAADHHTSGDTSDGPAVVSDSARMVSDPSENERCSKSRKRHHRPIVETEVKPQSPKRSNRISSPGDSHLNNILEEPSDISTALKNEEYFVPLGSTKEYYCRLLSSSHSEYCLKVDKKYVSSNGSVQSRDTDRGRYLYHENGRNRPKKSHSDFKLISNLNRRQQMYISKSDVFLDGRAKQVMKTIFMTDTQPLKMPKNFSAFKRVLNRTEFQITSCKECQTSDPKNDSLTNRTRTVNDKHFKEIYKTLEEGIVKTRPMVAEAAVSSMVFNDGYKSESRKTPRIKKVDIAVGSSVRAATSKKVFKNTEVETDLVVDVAVGESEVKLPAKAKVKKKSEAAPVIRKKSTAVSPIRVAEEPAAQVISKSPRKRQPPPTKTPAAKTSVQKTPTEPSPVRTNRTPRTVEIKRFQMGSSKQKMQVTVSQTPPATPQPASKQAVDDAQQQYIECIKVFRSQEDSCVDQNVQKMTTRKSNAEKCQEMVKRHVARNRTKKHCSAVESCFHYDDLPASLENEPQKRSVIAASNQPVIVGTAIQKGQHPGFKGKVSFAESSTSSSVSDAESADRSIRKSKSLVHISRTPQDHIHRSKSEMCCIKDAKFLNNKNFILATKESFVSDLEKFTNKPNLRCSSKSHGSSLDQYITSKFASRLLLTKDYKTGPMSAYQKRKLYDEAMRQKMKKNFSYRKDVDVGPQIFEVRFLSTMNEPRAAKKINHHKPIISVNVGSALQMATVSRGTEVLFKKSEKVLGDVGQEELKGICKKLLDLKVVDAEALKGATCTCTQFSQQCVACKNFLTLMDNMHSSLARYRPESKKALMSAEEDPPPPLVPALPPPLTVEEIYSACQNKVSSDSAATAVPSIKELDPMECISRESSEQENLPLILQPMSCPALATNTSSFEFLYEDTGSLENDMGTREAVLADLMKPLDNHQTFNFNTSQYNVEMPYLPSSYKGTAESVESGYASIKSQSCCAKSLVSFFKKPNIVALFKPPRFRETLSEGDFDKNLLYEEMTKSCQMYAKKVRQMSGLKQSEEEEEEYQEFSLQFLMSESGSLVLQSRALSVRSIPCESIEDEEEPVKLQDEEVSETYTAVIERSKPLYGCRLVLRNKCLKNDSVICLGAALLARIENEESLASMSYNNVSTEELLASLIRAYDKEVDVCNRLYENKDFQADLLAVVQDHKKQKKGGFSKLFSRRTASGSENKPTEDVHQTEHEVSLSVKLQTLASNARRCFTMLAEAVKLNKNIDNEQKIFGISRWLERIEKGEFQLMYEEEDDSDCEIRIKNEVKESFLTIYHTCSKEAKRSKNKIESRQLRLLMAFVMKCRVSLVSKADVISSCIARGVLRSEAQLKAAVTYLMRSNSEEVKLTEIAEYCQAYQ